LKKKLPQLVSLLFFFLGLYLLFGLIHKFGYASLKITFQRLGYEVIFVLFFPLTWFWAHTRGWYKILEEIQEHVSFFTLLLIRLAGEAVNTLTPISWMGGDPVRVFMLKNRMPTTLSAASVVLDRTMQSLAILLLLFFSLLVATIQLQLPPAWNMLFPLLTLGMALLIMWVIHRQHRGIFLFLAKGLKRIGVKKPFSEALDEKIGEIDERISQFYRHDRKRFFTVLGYHFSARLMGVFEIYMISHFLAISLSLINSLYLATLTVLVNMVFVFVPGSLGVLEGAYGALFHLLNLEPVAGVALQLVRRLRTVFWIFVGLIVIVLYKHRHPEKEIPLEVL